MKGHNSRDACLPDSPLNMCCSIFQVNKFALCQSNILVSTKIAVKQLNLHSTITCTIYCRPCIQYGQMFAHVMQLMQSGSFSGFFLGSVFLQSRLSFGCTEASLGWLPSLRVVEAEGNI